MDAIDYTPTMGKGHFDQNNPLSLWCKLGEEWAGRFMGKMAELTGADDCLVDETVLQDWLFRVHSYRPKAVDNRYRLQFWLEYENACKLGRPMNMANVYNLVGPEGAFHHLVMRDARRVVWMLCKPLNYEANSREILNTGMTRLKRALEVDALFNDDGTLKSKPDLKLLALQIKITQMFDMRLHGAPTQQIQTMSISATLGADGELQDMTDRMDAEAIKRRLEDMRRRKRLAEGRAPEGNARAAAPPAQEGSEPHASQTDIIDAEVVGEKIPEGLQ